MVACVHASRCALLRSGDSYAQKALLNRSYYVHCLLLDWEWQTKGRRERERDGKIRAKCFDWKLDLVAETLTRDKKQRGNPIKHLSLSTYGDYFSSKEAQENDASREHAVPDSYEGSLVNKTCSISDIYNIIWIFLSDDCSWPIFKLDFAIYLKCCWP